MPTASPARYSLTITYSEAEQRHAQTILNGYRNSAGKNDWFAEDVLRILILIVLLAAIVLNLYWLYRDIPHQLYSTLFTLLSAILLLSGISITSAYRRCNTRARLFDLSGRSLTLGISLQGLTISEADRWQQQYRWASIAEISSYRAHLIILCDNGNGMAIPNHLLPNAAKELMRLAKDGRKSEKTTAPATLQTIHKIDYSWLRLLFPNILLISLGLFFLGGAKRYWQQHAFQGGDWLMLLLLICLLTILIAMPLLILGKKLLHRQSALTLRPEGLTLNLIYWHQNSRGTTLLWTDITGIYEEKRTFYGGSITLITLCLTDTAWQRLHPQKPLPDYPDITFSANSMRGGHNITLAALRRYHQLCRQ